MLDGCRPAGMDNPYRRSGAIILVEERHSMRQRTSFTPSVAVFVSVWLVTACALFQSWQVGYLKSAVNHATKADVIRRMGTPRTTGTLNTGDSLLLYRVREYQAGDLNGPGRWWCEEYRLVFDRAEILRDWKQSAC
jgi:hypothetical protein